MCWDFLLFTYLPLLVHAVIEWPLFRSSNAKHWNPTLMGTYKKGTFLYGTKRSLLQ